MTVFLERIEGMSTYACLRSKGYSESDVGYLLNQGNASASHYDNLTQYPDASAIAAGRAGLPEVRGGSPAPSPGSVEATPSFEQSITSCERSQPTLVEDIYRVIDPLQRVLSQMTGTYMSSPRVVAATAAWSRCMARGGVDVKSVQDFIGYTTTLTQNAPDKSDPITPQLRSDMKLYGRCVGPLSNAMDSVRLADRRKFEDRYGAQIAQAQTEVTKDVDKLARQYGVKAPR